MKEWNEDVIKRVNVIMWWELNLPWHMEERRCRRTWSS